MLKKYRLVIFLLIMTIVLLGTIYLSGLYSDKSLLDGKLKSGLSLFYEDGDIKACEDVFLNDKAYERMEINGQINGLEIDIRPIYIFYGKSNSVFYKRQSANVSQTEKEGNTYVEISPEKGGSSMFVCLFIEYLPDTITVMENSGFYTELHINGFSNMHKKSAIVVNNSPMVLYSDANLLDVYLTNGTFDLDQNTYYGLSNHNLNLNMNMIESYFRFTSLRVDTLDLEVNSQNSKFDISVDGVLTNTHINRLYVGGTVQENGYTKNRIALSTRRDSKVTCDTLDIALKKNNYLKVLLPDNMLMKYKNIQRADL